MFNKIIPISSLVILNILFYFFSSTYFQVYNYSSIIIEVKKDDKYYRNFQNQFRKDLVSRGYILERSDFRVFESIQKWKIKNNILTVEKISENNIKNISKVLNDELNIKNNDLTLYQYFHINETKFKKNIDEIKYLFEKNNTQFFDKCQTDKNENSLNLKLEFDKLYEVYDEFLRYLLKKEIIRLNKKQEIECNTGIIKIYDNSIIQKYNLLFIFLFINLIIIILFLFLNSLINEIKKK